MEKRLLSKADAELITEVEGLGEKVSPYQLETWRQFGIIPETERHGQGRGPGMWSRYPQGSAGQVVAVIAQLRVCRQLTGAVFPLFVAGYPIRQDRLKTTCLEAIEAFRENCLHQAQRIVEEETGKRPTVLDSYEVAETLASALAAKHGDAFVMRQWLSKSPAGLAKTSAGIKEHPPALLGSVFTHIFYVAITGKSLFVNEAVRQETAHGTGVALVDTLLPSGSDGAISSPDNLKLVEAVSLPALKRVVRSAKVADIEWARGELPTLIALSAFLAEAIGWLLQLDFAAFFDAPRPKTSDSIAALLLPVSIVLRRLVGGELLAKFIAMAKEKMPAWRESLSLLSTPEALSLDQNVLRATVLEAVGRAVGEALQAET